VGFEQVVGAESAGCMDAGKILLNEGPAAWLLAMHLLQELKKIQLRKEIGILGIDCRQYVRQYVRHFTQVGVWIIIYCQSRYAP
jgi:hypothetical protein